MRTTALLSFLTVILIALSMPSFGHDAARIDQRIVAPYEVPVLAHVPVIAGYEPVPAPQPCGVDGTVSGVFYSEDFEGSSHDFTFGNTPLAWGVPNLWHVTDFPGKGPDTGHSAEQRLYFGIDASGTYRTAPTPLHAAGVAESGDITLPATEAHLAFADKWNVEWLKGYDHLWVEMLDVDTNTTHLLCHANSLDRGDASSTGDLHGVGSCSPLLLGPCPSLVDPEWEHRHTTIPDYLLGKTVRVRFTFDTSDDVANAFMGWMVDDVTIGTTLS